MVRRKVELGGGGGGSCRGRNEGVVKEGGEVGGGRGTLPEIRGRNERKRGREEG